MDGQRAPEHVVDALMAGAAEYQFSHPDDADLAEASVRSVAGPTALPTLKLRSLSKGCAS